VGGEGISVPSTKGKKIRFAGRLVREGGERGGEIRRAARERPVAALAVFFRARGEALFDLDSTGE